MPAIVAVTFVLIALLSTMLDISTVLWLIAGVGSLLVMGFLLGNGTDAIALAMFPRSGERDWPRGVQEPDVPRFDLDRLDALRRNRDA